MHKLGAHAIENGHLQLMKYALSELAHDLHRACGPPTRLVVRYHGVRQGDGQDKAVVCRKSGLVGRHLRVLERLELTLHGLTKRACPIPKQECFVEAKLKGDR